MATLEKIRTKAGLLVAIVIGVSLAAFILGGMLKSAPTIFRKDQMEVGKIDGESIQYPDFQKKLEELAEIYKQNTRQTQLDENSWVQVREQAWQTMIREIVMGEVYEDLGIDVSSDELFDMIQGVNLHPIIQQIFRNPNTGQVDRAAVVRFLKNLDTGVSPEQRKYWLYLENEIVEERKQSKYANMVGKGLYVTTDAAKQSLEANSKKVNFDYVALKINSVPDSLVTVSESDLKAYYKAHKNNFKQDKLRKIEYITFHVSPSKADYKDAENWINDIKSDFKNATDNVQFVNSNSDESFVDTWYKKEDLPANIAKWVFDEDAKVNDVFGPYFENDIYRLAKVNAIEMLPDSVKARHILLKVEKQEEVAAAQALADSLKTLVENGADFAKLAEKYSADKGSAVNGGDLGWFKRGQMVKPFEDAAFNNKVKEVTVVASQFGIHIVQTTKRGKLSKHVQIAYLSRKVEPSTRTYQDTYAKASKFAGENTTGTDFEEAVVKQKLNKRVATLRENDRQIPGLTKAREIVRSAFKAEEGDIIKDSKESPIFEVGDDFVIAVLTHAQEDGVADFENVKTRVELSVVREKKAQYLVEKANTVLASKTDLPAIAGELGSSVKNAANISFNSYTIPGLGLEPAVIGTVVALDVDKISKPVTGNNGVYIVKVTSVKNEDTGDVNFEQLRLEQSLNSLAVAKAFDVHKKAVEIIDKRSKFY